MSGTDLSINVDGVPRPLISVAMPVYNGEQYLAEAIDSILVQTFKNFELIIIDDGSTDNSLQVLRAYAKRDARIRLIAHENKNLATTLNDIIDLARGEWIARMDQDDVALPQRFERQLAWLEKTGADLAGSWVQRFGTADQRIVKLKQSDTAIKMEMLFCSPLAHPSVMMKTNLIKQLRYDKAWEKCEDYDLWERAAEAGWKMGNIPEVLLNYRVHPGQISSQKADRQLQLTQEIRRRYWHFVFNVLHFNHEWIDEVLKISETSCSHIDMDVVDQAFFSLLTNSKEEARDAIFHHATRLYMRVAADCPDIATRWGMLNQAFGAGSGVATKFQLWLFHCLRIRPHGNLFKQLRKFYVWRASQ